MFGRIGGLFLLAALVTVRADAAGPAASDVYFYMSDGRRLPCPAEGDTSFDNAPKLWRTYHGIEWRVFYNDPPGFGFNAFFGIGRDRRAALEYAIAYISDVLNEPGGVADVLVESFNDSQTIIGASAGPSFTGEPGLPRLNNGNLFEHITNGEVNPPGLFDLQVLVNFALPFHAGDDQTGSDEIDLRHVLIHELTHGLGFLSTLTFAGEGASCPADAPASGIGLFEQDPATVGVAANSFTQMTALLRTGNFNFFIDSNLIFSGMNDYFVGRDNGVFFDGPSTTAVTGTPPPIFAPESYLCGSSLSHFDLGTGAILEPEVVFGPTRLTYADIEIAALRDLGYVDAAAAPEPNKAGGCGCGCGGVESARGDWVVMVGMLVGLAFWRRRRGWQGK